MEKDARVSALYSYLTESGKMPQELTQEINEKYQVCIERVRL